MKENSRDDLHLSGKKNTEVPEYEYMSFRKIIKGVRYKSYEESYDECTCDNKMKVNNENGDARWRCLGND